ncbi:malto-oligosyltrehalose trehalohydrolase [Nocardioides kribbensis]|uniref:malto-oligosyltrehalose trehalohydrolase n=1 Tax=Nocardioides kribbensis TaxID=305517 RepID=UPI0032DB524F
MTGTTGSTTGTTRAPARGPFDVWAPVPDRVRLHVAGAEPVAMTRGDDGWWTPAGEVPGADSGPVDYGYLLDDDDTPRPDPRSRRQPDGVHGLSRSFDPSAYAWGDGAWTGRQLAGSVVYELHVGTFTPEGTLDAALGRLDHLVDLGVDLVEVMPVNAFNGTHNWGYDGVDWYAVDESYGGPEAYQRFVDGCHAAGLGVVQDVVYNHLGPSGNYLPLFGPYLTEGRNTWGDLVNLDQDGSAEVRRYILDNVAMWLEDYHVDALRLDAVHALQDTSAVHLLEEMGLEVAALSAHLRRPLTLIAESDLNDARMVTPREGGGRGLDAQWSDDFHHAVHVALTGETTGYYADFEPLEALAKVMTRGFFHDGTYSSFREADHGRPVDTATMPTWRLVVCNQNHDQIGNRAVGDRLTEHLDEGGLGLAALLTLTGPFTPMLFQGEEWAASTPFQFFTSHPEPELGTATAEGRIAEFAKMGWDPDAVPDPQDPATFERSKLDWSQVEDPAAGDGVHARVLDLYRRLVALRRARPELTDPAFGATTCEVDASARLVTLGRGALRVVANLGDRPVVVTTGPGEVLLATADGVVLDASGTLTLPAHAGAVVEPA